MCKAFVLCIQTWFNPVDTVGQYVSVAIVFRFLPDHEHFLVRHLRDMWSARPCWRSCTHSSK